MATTANQKAETENSIGIKDVGPIESAMIPLPSGGGVTELVGSNGVGKSTALRSVSAVISGKGRKHNLTPRSDSDQLNPRGEINFGEVSIKVRHSVTHKGSAEVCHLEGRLDLETFVDPGLQDVKKNDERRIKALISLTGVEANIEDLSDLVGGDEAFNDIASAKTIASADLISMVSNFKRDLHTRARSLEDDGNKAEGKASALRASITGVELDSPCDELRLADAHRQEIRNLDHLADRLDSQNKAETRHTASRKRLDKLMSDYHGPTQEQADGDHNEAARVVIEIEAEMVALSDRKAEAEFALREATSGVRSANEYFRMIAECKKTLDSTLPGETITDKDVEEAREAEIVAKDAMFTGAAIREAIKAEKLSREWRGVCEKQRKQAVVLREAAVATDDVLASAIHSDVLRVNNGRLEINHPRYEKPAYFHDLSNGERWLIAIDLAIETLARNGIDSCQRILQISQHAWEGLDPVSRAAIDSHARRRGVNIVTALADDGPLRARVFSGDAAYGCPAWGEKVN